MKIEKIQQTLIGHNYSPRIAEKVASELMLLEAPLVPLLESWIEKGEETDYEASGYSVKGFMTSPGMKYPAALLTIDWILKEPEKAIAAIKHGIR